MERARQHRLLVEFLSTGRGIAFPDMFAMREYPADVLPLYSQGYSLARFLIERGGRHKYVAFVGDGLATENWPAALASHYGVGDLAQLQHVWLEWVKRGCPAPPAVMPPPSAVALAAATPRARGQSPDAEIVPIHVPQGPAALNVSGRRSIYSRK